jgi:hypothetical protein
MSNEIQVSPASVFSLAPKTMEEAFKLAEMMANSDFVPKAYQGKPGNVLVAVQMGQELGLKPMASLQNIGVINGKPGIYGDAGKAILLANGCQIEEDDTSVIRKTEMGRCVVTRPGHAPVERTFSVADAKTAGLWNKEGPWKTYPLRQLAWRAFWFAARDAAADLLKGFDGVEALADMPAERDVTPPAKRQTGAQAAESAREQAQTGASEAITPAMRENAILDLELIAREQGAEEYKAAWSALTKAFRVSIGVPERDRIMKIAESIPGEATESVDPETGEVSHD